MPRVSDVYRAEGTPYEQYQPNLAYIRNNPNLAYIGNRREYVIFDLLSHAAFVADEVWGFVLEPARTVLVYRYINR